MSFNEFVSLKTTICWFNLNYLIKTTYDAYLWQLFNSPTSKNIPDLQLKFRKILTENTTTLEQQITGKNYMFSKRFTLETNLKNSIELILNPVLKCLYLLFKDRLKSTMDQINHGRFINQFPSDILRLILQLERMNTKICRQKCLYCLIKYVLTNKCCLNTYTYTHARTHARTHTHTHIYIYIYIYTYHAH